MASNTKKSLLASGLALCASAALLMGSTFAWFTDSVTNTGNVITAGSLRIDATAYDVYDATVEGAQEGMSVTLDGRTATFEAAGQDLKTDSTPIIGDTLFEPGKSNLKLLQVSNSGTLAAKVKLEFDVTDGGLMDALWFDFVQVGSDGTVTGQLTERPMDTLAALADTVEISLSAGESVSFVLIYGMNEEAGNEYQDKTFEADVTVLATQYTEETDGFGSDQYDKDANYDNAKVVTSADGSALTTEEFAASVNDSAWENIVYDTDVVIDDTVNIYTDCNLDFGGNTVTSERTLYLGRTNGYQPAPITATIEDARFEITNSSGRLRAEDGSTVTFKDVTFASASASGSSVQAVQVYASTPDSVNTYVFENCVFDNTTVAFEGGSGAAYEYNVQFINCTFTGSFGNGGAAVTLDDYAYGTALFDGCSFDITANGNAVAAIRADTYADYVSPNTMAITLKDVAFTGTSTESYYSTRTPVPVAIKPFDPVPVTVTEEGACSYITDGEPVSYDGEAL